MDTPIQFLKIPLAFFGLPSPIRANQDRLDSYVNFLKDEMHKAVTAGGENKTLSEDLLNAVRAMPLVLYRIKDDFIIPPDCFPILWDHLYLVLFSYLQDPDGNRSLEKMIGNSPEYGYHLLQAHEKAKKQGKGFSLELSEGYYLQQMMGNPYWAIHWYEQHRSDELFREIISRTFMGCSTEAPLAHCFHHLRTHRMPPGKREEEMVKILNLVGNDPWFSFATALEFPNIDSSLLLEHIIDSPVWNYNWLRWVAPRRKDRPELREQMLEKLLTFVPWLVQYLADMNPDDWELWLTRATERVRNPYWERWMELFVKQYTNLRHQRQN